MNQSLIHQCPQCYLHELDIDVLRSNNGELATTVAELKQEVASLKERNKYLQEQFFTIHSKLLSTAIIPAVEATVRKCVPKLMEITDEMTKLSQLCHIGTSAQTSDFKGVRTFAVTPHTVNGHVLNNPIINIPRLSNSGISPKRNSTEKTNACRSPASSGLAGPSRSTGREEENVYIRVRAPPVSIQYVEEPQDEIRYDELEQDSTFNETRSEGSRKLSVIPEVSGSDGNSSSRSPCSSQIRIYIDRINVDQVNHSKKNLRHSLCNSSNCENSQIHLSADKTVEITNPNGSNSAILIDDSSSATVQEHSMYPPQASFREFFETLSLVPASEQPRNSTPFKNKRPDEKFPHFDNFVTKRRNYRSPVNEKVVQIRLERMDIASMLSSPTNESEKVENEVLNGSERKGKHIPKTRGSVQTKQPQKKKAVRSVIEKKQRPMRAARPAAPMVEPNLNRKLRRDD